MTDPAGPGRFITIEGGDGAGKTTQVAMLAAALDQLGLTVLRTREPGGAPGAEFLRGVLLSGEPAWTAQAETLLHVAARVEHVERTIRPALAAGWWVICDRFADSTMAYQGFGQGVDRAVIAALAGMVGLIPDITFMLDLPPAAGHARLRARGGGADRYERLGLNFHARVSDGFRAIARADPARCVLLDADRPAAAIHAALLAALRAREKLA